ncbi:MAG: D-alanine--D-alanine ligase family protein [Candidatus Paceibacterota bacterium]
MNNSKRINVALLCGGKSGEHEVSLLSARNVYDSLDKTKYNVVIVGIDKMGRWFPISENSLIEKSGGMNEIASDKGVTSVSIIPSSADLQFSDMGNGHTPFDVVIPILHGPYGEDGSVQGLLKLANIPYVGAGVLGSAVGMDKDVMKRLLRDAGLPIGKFVTLYKHRKSLSYVRITKKLGSPIFIKPANLGSSVGVSRVDTKKEYEKAVAEAFKYDTKIIIEEYIDGREIECAILGNEEPVASIPGEIATNKSHHAFYSYEAKYLDEQGADLIIPASLTKKQTRAVQDLAVKVFTTLCCEGMARVDFFFRENSTFVVNEINTIPGFTSMSMYPKLWEASGISNEKLIDTLIQLAIKRFKVEQKLVTK